MNDLKVKINKSTQKLNLIYQWIKNDKIMYKQFLELLVYIEEQKRKDILYDI